MLILSIAGGIAFTYQDFVEDGPNKGTILSVLKGNWNSFFQDYRLIRPKKRGFITSCKIEDLQPKLSERFLADFNCKVDMKELKINLSTDYL